MGAEPKPDYLGDHPIDVRIGSLHDFARLVQQELETNVAPAAQILLTKLGAADFGQERSFGRDPRHYQGVTIGNYHLECQDRAARLLDGLQRGLSAIATAARQIADDYENNDELNQMDMYAVNSYFGSLGSSSVHGRPGGFGSRRAV